MHIEQEQSMKLADIVVENALRANLQASTRDEAIAELVQALAEAGAIASDQVESITKSILAREAQATTGLGKGVALPHAKLPSIKKPIVTFGISKEGIDFNSLDSQPVYSIILLLSPAGAENSDEHLQAMETIFKHVQRDLFRKFLTQAQTPEEIAELLHEADNMN